MSSSPLIQHWLPGPVELRLLARPTNLKDGPCLDAAGRIPGVGYRGHRITSWLELC